MTTRAAILALASIAGAGCGPHLVTYRLPSHAAEPTTMKTEMHSHGIGPFLIGGGGYFLIISEISPALVDWTGPVDTTAVCPDGFAEVSHRHELWQSVVAALISWGGIVNWWHPSYVEWKCLDPPPSPPTSVTTGVAPPP